MSELVVVRQCNYRHEAELIRSALDSCGIDATVSSDDCGAFDPALGMARGVSVLVDDADLERAEDALSGLAGGGDDDGPQNAQE